MTTENCSIKDVFFFYLIEGGQDLLQAALRFKSGRQNHGGNHNGFVKEKYPGTRQSALAEIRDLELILTGNKRSPEYCAAEHDFWVRIRRLNYPPLLAGEEGMKSYYDYLIETVQPTANELMKG